MGRRLGKVAIALSYDRGDYGFSETDNYPRTGATISRELAALLESETLEGPKVMVGALLLRKWL